MTMLGKTIAVGLVGSALLFCATAAAQDGAALFAQICSGCHNDLQHPKLLVYNAAGNVAIIEAVNAKGMGAAGSLEDHTSIAAYLDSVKPAINMAPVAHDSPGTAIPLLDIIVSAAEDNAFLKIIDTIATVSPPTKGTVTYTWARGYAKPSLVTYTPFPGQSGIDTWTYQGTGSEANTTVRTASVNIASDGSPPPLMNIGPGFTGAWYDPAQSGHGLFIEVLPNNAILAWWFTFSSAGDQSWFGGVGNITGTTATISQVLQTTGGKWIPNFDPSKTTNIPWGTLTFTFTDCNHGRVDFNSTVPGYAAGFMNLTRLTLPAGLTCP
jgi:hypothetical protein